MQPGSGASLLMALSMVINESLVARTFGTYTLRAFGGDTDSILVPILGVGLIVFAYLVNASGTRSVGLFSIILSIAICVVVYLLVAFAVASSLPLDRIEAAKDYALAEAAQPAIGQTGFYLTVALALVFLFMRVFLADNPIKAGNHDPH